MITKEYIPSSGTDDEAGGVEAASSLSNRKKATNTFIPEITTIWSNPTQTSYMCIHTVFLSILYVKYRI